MVSTTVLDELASGKRTCMNLSFSGCGFLGIYHVGVASCFKEYAPHLFAQKITGASAGALAACALITNCCLGEITSYVLRVAMKARSRALGPLHPSFDVVAHVREGLESFLPHNAHEIASGRLFVSLTRVSDWRNVLVSQFDTKEELMEALICSSFVPFYSGLIPPKYKGQRHIDGGITDNNPILDENTITVAPFAGESDISPKDNSSNFAHISVAGTSIQFTTTNLYRLSHALFPPEPEILSRMCQQGFDDALKFLQKNHLLSCGRHLNICSSITQAEPIRHYDAEEEWGCCPSMDSGHVDEESGHDGDSDEDPLVIPDDLQVPSEEDEGEEEEEDEEVEDDCEDCKHKQHVALGDSLPTAVVDALQKASNSDKGILSSLYNMRLYKVASFMAVPCVLPLDIALATAMKLYQWAPYMPGDMQWFVKQLVNFIQALLDVIQASRHQYSARLTCQLAITEMTSSDTETSPTRRRHHSSGTRKTTKSMRQVSMGFSVDFHSHYPSPLECVKGMRSHLLHENNIPEDQCVAGSYPVENSSQQNTSQNLPRRKSGGHIPCNMSYDTFENCLHVAEQMDAVLAFHYLDEKDPNTYKVTEIFALDEEIKQRRWRDFSMNSSSEMSWDNYAPLKPELDSACQNSRSSSSHGRSTLPNLELSYSELS